MNQQTRRAKAMGRIPLLSQPVPYFCDVPRCAEAEKRAFLKRHACQKARLCEIRSCVFRVSSIHNCASASGEPVDTCANWAGLFETGFRVSERRGHVCALLRTRAS